MKDFTRFLNRNYYVHSHLAERLDELTDSVLFVNFHTVIADTIFLLEKQLGQLDHLFNTIGAVSYFPDCEATIAWLEGVFTRVQDKESGTPIIALLDYLSIADALLAEGANLAEMSIARLPELNVPGSNLYDSERLKPLIVSLKGIHSVT